MDTFGVSMMIVTRKSKIMSCNICDKHFENIKDLMTHKKKQHCDRVAMCWKFASGHCSYGDNGCWFIHSPADNSQESSNIKCNSCDQEFKCKAEVLKHSKHKHSMEVMKCRNEKDGKCTFGSKKCWFIHDDHEDVRKHEPDNGEQSNAIQKVFGKLETMTERIINIEKHNLEGSNENN